MVVGADELAGDGQQVSNHVGFVADDDAIQHADITGLEPDQQTLVWVPGAFELPLLAARLAASGRFDAVIALGAVIRGGTPHFDYVAGSCAEGLSRVALDHEVPVVFGVLTTDDVEQALERAGTGEGNKGFDSAVTALEMVDTLHALQQFLATEA